MEPKNLDGTKTTALKSFEYDIQYFYDYKLGNFSQTYILRLVFLTIIVNTYMYIILGTGVFSWDKNNTLDPINKKINA